MTLPGGGRERAGPHYKPLYSGPPFLQRAQVRLVCGCVAAGGRRRRLCEWRPNARVQPADPPGLPSACRGSLGRRPRCCPGVAERLQRLGAGRRDGAGRVCWRGRGRGGHEKLAAGAAVGAAVRREAALPFAFFLSSLSLERRMVSRLGL